MAAPRPCREHLFWMPHRFQVSIQVLWLLHSDPAIMAPIRGSLQKRTKISGDGIDLAVTLSICLFIVSIMAGLRLWASRIRKQAFNAADFMSLVSLLLFYSYALVSFLILTIGHVGYPISETSSWRRTFTLKGFFYTQLAFGVGIGAAKFSIICVCFQIHSFRKSSTLRLVSRLFMATCFCWCAMAIIGGISGCQPLAYNWNLESSGGHCINRHAASLAIGILDIASNVAMAVTLILMSRNVQMSRPRMLANISILALGTLYVSHLACRYAKADQNMAISGIASSILRTTTILHTDFTIFNQTAKMVFLWTAVEWVVAMIVFNALMLGPIFDRFFPEKEPERNAPSQGLEMPDSFQYSSSRGATYTAEATTGETISTWSCHKNEPMPNIQINLPPEPGEVRIQTEWAIERS
ncbi:hypothetical protein P175DRAFT_0103726 [Aspergillus ochraceoroseus IBT 24754]|uniref:Rhodopsin domain-containing protein n=1 Tax=Aspergillus ochraceoroseus IBT 24754 TaxID=1392256 RepID=A0A2T5LLU1_9EURO|nr:uncharacterized protein P175DRAFT_0103726 [Aspergillus ochraceoroseus IBT 24754]PTU17245.1 hypothetical protein P175DRAFT_0103726 [Aspergillus ochraceoroseus IBT 24754]